MKVENLRIYIDDRFIAEASMREDVAPRTARAIWDALPITSRLMHGTCSGEATFFAIDVPLSIDVEEGATGSSGVAAGGFVVHNERLIIRENETCFVSQGDLVLTPYKACMVAYGRRAMIRSYVGELPSNAFAFVRDPGQLDELERVSKETLAYGAKKIELRR